ISRWASQPTPPAGPDSRVASPRRRCRSWLRIDEPIDEPFAKRVEAGGGGIVDLRRRGDRANIEIAQHPRQRERREPAVAARCVADCRLEILSATNESLDVDQVARLRAFEKRAELLG